MTANLAGLLLVNLLWLGAGLGVTGLAGWWTGRDPFHALAISYLAGVAAYGVLAQALFVAGASLSRVELVLVCAVLALGVIRPLRNVSPGQWPRVRRPPWEAVLVVVVVGALAVDLWFEPLWAYDSWTFWTPKARALFTLGLDPSWFGASDLLNRDYPVLLPAVEAAGFRFTGYETALLDIQSLFFIAVFLAAFAQIVIPRAPRWARAIPVLIVVSPSIADQLANAEADIPLAVFFACAVLYAYLWHRRHEPGALALFGVFAAGTAATKAEGLLFVLALALAVGVAEAQRSRSAAARFAVTAAVAAGVALVPWRLWMSAHGIPNQSSLSRVSDAAFLADHVSRVPIAAAYMAARIIDPRAWLLLVPLLAVLTAAAVRQRRPDALLVLAIVALSLGTLLLAYWTTPFELHYHLATSARRVITGPILAWATVLPLLFERDRPPDAAATLRRA
jgi:hypothetical protein